MLVKNDHWSEAKIDFEPWQIGGGAVELKLVNFIITLYLCSRRRMLRIYYEFLCRVPTGKTGNIGGQKTRGFSQGIVRETCWLFSIPHCIANIYKCSPFIPHLRMGGANVLP